MKKLIIVIFLVSILLISCNKAESEIYTATYVGNENWEVGKIELIVGKKDQEFKYTNIEYKGNKSFITEKIIFEFFIVEENSSNGNEKTETLLARSEGSNDGVKINNEFLAKGGGIKGELLNRKMDYDYKQIYLKVMYEIDNEIIEEIIEMSTNLENTNKK